MRRIAPLALALLVAGLIGKLIRSEVVGRFGNGGQTRLRDVLTMNVEPHRPMASRSRTSV